MEPATPWATDSDLALVRKQAAAAARKLMSPAAYAGMVRELALTGFHVTTYPLGMARGMRREEQRWRPRSLRERSLLARDPETACTPVILIHGYFHNRSAFLMMSRTLKRAGFQHIHGLNYNPLTQGVPELAAVLAAEVERVLKATGAEKCQIVGHSMGGLIARYYVSLLGGEDTVDTVITLGTPHRGTYSAYLGVGAGAADMRPGSAVMRDVQLASRPSDVRWISYYSDLDLLVTPAVSAKLVHPALQATNLKLRDTGHLSLLLSGEVLHGIVEHLIHRDVGRPQPMPEVASIPTSAQLHRRGTVAVESSPQRLPAEQAGAPTV
jgi:triacylglycerol lipase